MANINETKEPKKIKIAGWEFTSKQIFVFVVIVGLVFLFSWYSDYKQKKADAEKVAQEQEALEKALNDLSNVKNPYDSNRDYLQEALVEQYGVPPEGFKWSATGDLVAVGDELPIEDVIYAFLRSLSMGDFSIAEKYSSSSAVIDDYKNYYSVVTQSITSYYDNFLRKQFSESIKSLAIDGVDVGIVLADGTCFATVKVSCLDLTNKDFWEKDRDELFSQMRIYRDTETDNTKLKQYVFDYIYDAYINNVVGKKQYTIQLVCDKNYGGGWLVSNDKELAAVLKYENGVDVAQFIFDEFEDWYLEVTLEEQLGG